MFSWFRKPKPPPPSQSPESDLPIGGLRVNFSSGDRKWTEYANIFDLLAAAISSHGHRCNRLDNRIELPDSGFVLSPDVDSIQLQDSGSVSTTTIVRAEHPRLVPAGVFEFQHSAGANLEESLRGGFDLWVQVDMPVLLDTLRDKPSACTVLQMDFLPKDGVPGRHRRALLGPVAHFAQQPAPVAEDHPFCACCLLTNTLDAFRNLVESDDFFALRFFAARDADGSPQADCRVNGEDYDAGKAALIKYIEKWPDRGFEFRKQYVVLQATPGSTGGNTNPAAWRT
jgi:hypothetical protein